MNSQLSCILIKQLRWAWICLFLVVLPVYGQSDINIEGAIDTRVHSSPDSAARSIDADDLARLAKEKGMRGLVLKNHWESTAALAYMVRKEVPGIEIFGGIVLNTSAEAIRKVGPKFCILATNFGAVRKNYPLHPQALLDFMEALHKEGISVADINLMAKTNPALALGLTP
jgi:hypothetical protein